MKVHRRPLPLAVSRAVAGVTPLLPSLPALSSGGRRSRPLRILGLVAVVVFVFTALRGLFATHPSSLPPHDDPIYEYTEGKTTGEWRDEYWFDKSNIAKHRGGTGGGAVGGADADATGSGTATSGTKAGARPEHGREELAYLLSLARTYDLTSEVPLFARRVQAKSMVPPSSSSSNVKTLPPPSLTDAGVPLFNPNVDFERVRTKSPDTPQRGVDKDVLTLSTPGGQGAEAVDASALLFGVASNYDRLMYGDQALMHDWSRWLTDGRGKSNGAGLVVVLQMAPSAKQVSTIRDELQRLGIDAAVASAADRPDETAYQQVVTRLLRGRFHGLRGLQRQQVRGSDAKADEDEDAKDVADAKARKYFGIIEEDVFFPSMARLLEKLAPFSPDKEYYIGAPSEQSDWEVDNGTALTYGGGAVFTTAPLLDKVGAECLQEPASAGGTGSSQVFDVLLHDCIAKHIGASMHVLPSLYNPVAPPPPTADVGGYGSGMRPLTLHHYRNWHRFEAGKGHRVTSACGEACFLQRFLFADGWVLVNGYTLTHYPQGVEAVPVYPSAAADPAVAAAAEEARKKAAADAPRLDDRLVIEEAAALDLAMPPRDAKTLTSPGRTKKTWRLLDSRTRDNGDVWQAYVNRKGGDNSFSEIDDRLASDIRHSDEEKSDVDSVILLIWEAPAAPARTKAKALA